jgi:fatty acid desaturase
MSRIDDKRLCAALLVAATLAVTLIAGLTAWAAWLGGGAWLRVLAPFALVLLAPVAMLLWLLNADTDADELPEEPAAAEQDPVVQFHRDPGSRVDRKAS